MEKMRPSSRIKQSGAVAKLPKIKISFPGVRARAAQAARGFETLFNKRGRVDSPHPRPCGMESCPPTPLKPPPMTLASMPAPEVNHPQSTFSREPHDHWSHQPAAGRSRVIIGSRKSSQQRNLLNSHDILNQPEYSFRLHP